MTARAVVLRERPASAAEGESAAEARTSMGPLLSRARAYQPLPTGGGYKGGWTDPCWQGCWKRLVGVLVGVLEGQNSRLVGMLVGWPTINRDRCRVGEPIVSTQILPADSNRSIATAKACERVPLAPGMASNLAGA